MAELKPLIMIVDDHPDVLRVVRVILEGEGYQVWTAINGQQALERLEAGLVRRRQQGYLRDDIKYVPDLILSDIMMPVMDGYDFFEQTRTHPALNHIPFIFLSAKSEGIDIRRGKELGVDDYLTKPVQHNDLLASVRGKLRRLSQRRALMAQFIGDPDKPPALGVILLLVFVLLLIAIAVVVTLFLVA